MFTGGTPVDYVTPDVNITLMQGKSLSMLSCDGVIVDFITVPSSPYMEGQFSIIYVYYKPSIQHCVCIFIQCVDS